MQGLVWLTTLSIYHHRVMERGPARLRISLDMPCNQRMIPPSCESALMRAKP